MPDIKYNLQDNYDNNLGAYRLKPAMPTTAQAYYENTRVNDWSANYGFVDWAKDAARDYYRNIQKGEMNEQQDIMSSAIQNKADAQDLLEAWEMMDSAAKDEINAAAQEQARQSLENLRKNGAWSEATDPTAKDLENIIKSSQQKYDEANESYLHNLEQYNSSMNVYDISQYYNRKSNEAVMGWGNWFYKMPATMGTSATSPFLQTTSMAVAMAGGKAGAAAGAVLGPWGAAAGAVLGAVAGGQFAGGMQSREYESHMEAFMAQYEKFMQEAEKKGIDLDKAASNIKQQLEQRGVDTRNMDREMIIQAGLSTDGIVSGVDQFDDAVKESYKGTRRVYEQNNALGFGEALSDLTYFIPAGKMFASAGKSILKGVGKGLSKVTGNKLTLGLGKRFETGVEISKLGSKLRNKQLWDTFTNAVLTTPFRSAMEATEEGAQAMIVDEFLEGKFDKDYANDNFLEALGEGQVFKDLWENTERRFNSLGAVLNLNSEYKDDQQFMEEMLMGALLPFTNAQGIAANAVSMKNTYDKIFNSKRVGDYIASALQTQDQINRNTELFKTMREGVGSNKNYSELLDNLQAMLKERDSEGRTKYGLDSTTLTNDNSVPTDKDIDDFFEEQHEEYDNLRKFKKVSKKQLDSLAFEDKEDEDLFLALKYNTRNDHENAKKLSAKNMLIETADSVELAKEPSFVSQINEMIGREATADELLDYAEIALLNQEIDNLSEAANQAQAETKIRTFLANADKPLVTRRVLEDAAESLISYSNQLTEVTKQRDQIIKKLVEDGDDQSKSALSMLDIPTDIELEKISRITNNSKVRSNTRVVLDSLNRKNKLFDTVEKDKVMPLINRYREMQRRQSELADNANEAARNNSEPTIPAGAQDTPKFVDLTQEEINAQEEEVKTNIHDQIETFKGIIDSIPEESKLYSVVQHLKRGAAFSADNDISYARFASRAMKRAKTQYANELKKENLKEEEKEQLTKLETIASHFEKQLDNLLGYAAETKARAQRHNLGLKTNSTVWFDENGNRYNFDNNSAEYSENEGVILRMRPITEQEDETIDNLITNLQKSKQKLTADTSEDATKMSKSIDDLIAALTETKDAGENKVITINAKDPFLRILKSKTNLGEEIEFGYELDKYISKADRLIKQNKEHRNNKTKVYAEGDVYEFDLNDNSSNRKTGPSYRKNQIEDDPDRPLMVKAIALNTPHGAQQASKLMNPHYSAKYWYGSIKMMYSKGEDAKQYFDRTDRGEQDWGSDTRYGKKLNRYKAIDLFNAIGKELYSLTSNKKKKLEDIAELLQKLANGEEKVKIGKLNVKKEEYENMIYSLPLQAFMWQAHTGKQATIVHLVDFMSRGRENKPSTAEIKSRVELINNLLLTYKEGNKNRETTPELEEAVAFDQETADETFTNALYFGEKGKAAGAVQIVYGDFDYNLRTEKNPNLDIFKDDAGNQLDNQQIEQIYQDKLQQALLDIEPYVDDLVTLLNNLDYKIDKDTLLKENTKKAADGSDVTTSKLSELLLNVAKYGDGVISLHGTMLPNLSRVLGGIVSDKKSVKNANLQRAKKLLSFFQDKTPDLFLTYRNFQDENRLTPSVELSVEDVLENNWFNSKSSIKIRKKDGTVLGPNNTEKTKLVQIFKNFEKALRESNSATEFLAAITSEYDFVFNADSEEGTSEKSAIDVLREYFNNRRFSRLSTPTNIVQAITKGTATPMNGAVNYENFNRIVNHIQGNISEVSALGLVKDENGVYHFSLEKWKEHNVRTKSKTKEEAEEQTEGEDESQTTELEERLEALNKDLEEKVKEVDALKARVSAVIEFLETNAQSLFVVDENTGEEHSLAETMIRTNKKSEKILTSHGIKITTGYAKQLIKEALEKNHARSVAELEQAYTKEIEEELQEESENELDGKTTLPFNFAFGSYDTGNGASIIYYDKDGNTHSMEMAQGTPGAIYMIVPAFLTSARTKLPVKLNPKRFDRKTATVIAKLLNMVRNGLSLDTIAENLDLGDDMRIESTMSVRQVLDELIYIGNEAIINNASDEDFERLLYIDDNNQILFGEDQLDDSNFSKLVEFIQTKKTYRIDRQKAGNPYATFGGDVKISVGETVLFERKADDNYVASIIDNGILQTDLSTSQKSHMFTNPSAYINYNKKYAFTVPNDKKSTNSAASGKNKLKEDLEAISPEELEEELQEESLKEKANASPKEVQEYSENFIKKLKKAYLKAIRDKVIQGEDITTPGKISLRFYGLVSKKLNEGSFSVTYDPENDAVSIDNIKKFQNTIMKISLTDKKIAVVFTDSEDNFLQIGDKKFYTITEKFTLDGEAKQKVKSVSVSNDTDLVAALTEAFRAVAAEMRTASQPSGIQPTSNTNQQNNSVSGIVGLDETPASGTKKSTQFVEVPKQAKKKSLSFNHETGEYTYVTSEGNDVTWKVEEGQDPVEFAEEMIGNDMADGFDYTEEEIEEITKAVTASFSSDSSAGSTRSAVLAAAKIDYTEATKPKQEEKKGPKKAADTEIKTPTWKEVKSHFEKNKDGKAELNKIRDEKSYDERLKLMRKLYVKYLVDSKIIENQGKATKFVQDLFRDNAALRSQIIDDLDPTAKAGSVLDFLDSHVEKEDYDKALAVVERILGKGFDLSFLPSVEREYDHSRQAMIYVFGQCASSGIRLFRDANNKIAKGSFYHEAFHKVSLFILNEKSRMQMYEDARNRYSELEDATDKQVEEFLAEKFAEFVSNAELRKDGKYYSSNPIYRFFQKMFDKIRTLINRLTSANITPAYVDMDKLFRDMYSGRFAYAKATAENKELFDKIYSGFTPFTGFVVNGVELANSATQYQTILRDLVGKFVRTQVLKQLNTGKVQFDGLALYSSVANDLATFKKAIQVLENAKNLDSTRDNVELERIKKGDVLEGIARLYDIVETYEKIIKEDNWAVWQDVLSNFVETNFRLTHDEEDPQTAENIIEGSDNEEGLPDDSNEVKDNDKLNISYLRDSYMKSMFDATSANMKMLLWSVSQYDPNDPNSGKFTSDGLLRYENVRQIFRDVISAITGSVNMKDMMNRLEREAEIAAKENHNYGLKQLCYILNDKDTHPAIKNRFFTDFVRTINQFANHNYEIEVKGSGEDAYNTYNASVRSGNMENIIQGITYRWKSEVMQRMLARANKTIKQIKDEKEKVNQAISKMVSSDTASIRTALQLLQEYYGFGINQNIEDDVILFQKFLRRDGANIKNLINGIRKRIDIAGTKEEKINDTIKALFGEKGQLTQLAERMGGSKRVNPKSDSMRGPGGNKVYAIGAYNFITRLFETRIKQKSWRDKMQKNPYCRHSKWLKQILTSNGEMPIIVHPKLGTILDGDYQNSTADISLTPSENLLNLFTSIMSGTHTIPALANKRFAADIDGFDNLGYVFDGNYNIISSAFSVFTGYVADELLAIREAMRVRDEFISKLNKVLHSDYSIDTFSSLTATEQENIFKNNKEAAMLLKDLVSQYHYTTKGSEFKHNSQGRIVRRAFHIDLRNGSGYKMRHFKSLQNSTMIRQFIEEMKNVSEKNEAVVAFNFAKEYNSDIIKALQDNILLTVNRFIDLGLIRGNKAEVGTGKVVRLKNIADSLTNVFLPENLLNKWDGGKNKNKVESSIFKSIAYFTLQNMSDMIEFEKIVSGDIGLHKDIDSVNKRYSGLVSTIQITAENGTIQNAFEHEDRLYDSETFNAITLNTSLVINEDKFRNDALVSLGIDCFVGLEIGKGEVVSNLDHTRLLDENGELKKEAKNAPLIKRYIESRDNNRTMGLNENGESLTDEQIAIAAIADVKRRFEGFLGIDPTDGQAFITAELYRQLRQREGNWNDVDEACYNLLEHYDELPRLAKNYPAEFEEMCDMLDIKSEDLLKKAKEYSYAKNKNNQEKIDEFKGYIYAVTAQLQATSLKYVYYGETVRNDNLYAPVYVKPSLSPIFKIFADGHEMFKLYSLMKENQIDAAIMDSAIKLGCGPCFELFDEEGKVDARAVKNSNVQQFYFELIGKQLNTDAHEMKDTALLTQFMKIAVMNIQNEERYQVGENTVRGDVLKQVYIKILDELTDRGYKKFRSDFGITDEGINKEKLMSSLQKMALTQGLPADTIAAFDTNADGEFIIHPAGIPNVRWIQSRLLAKMGKTIIDTVTPGQALYQVASVGYDNMFDLKQHPDMHLLMPGEKGAKRMQVKLPILFFMDIINEAKKNKEVAKRYNLNNFEGQKKFILENQELFALSYRVPTQGQNSTLPVEIVDIFPPQRGAIISFPTGITALTGSDFDIDKMFLARPAFTIDKNGKVAKVSYNLTKMIASDLTKFKKEELQNALIDIFQSVLMSKENYLAANTPLDVCTSPVKDFIIEKLSVKHGSDVDPKTIDGYFANPVFQTDQKAKNAASNEGIGPMALNSVFRFLIQMSDLKLRYNELLENLGLNELNKVYDKDGEDILDMTSALINAFVDAAKDPYIGDGNVNNYTFDIANFLVAAGNGRNTLAFLGQPIIKDLAQAYKSLKLGKLAVNEEDRIGDNFIQIVLNKWGIEKNDGRIADKNELTMDALTSQIENPSVAQQVKYLNLFLALKDISESYRQAITVAQIDTKKYGINVDELISFMQQKEQFTSAYNVAFENPQSLFDNTFLGRKYEKGLEQLFDVFSDIIFEFSPVYKNTLDVIAKQYNKYGRYSKKFLHVVGPKVKTVLLLPFFNEYLAQRYGGKYPLRKLVYGKSVEDSVPGRYEKIKKLCMQEGIGTSLFEVLGDNFISSSNQPNFFNIDRIINEDQFIKGNVQSAISELGNSSNDEIRQWAADFAVYMFYLTGGNDASAGGIIKTTMFDVIPPQLLSRLKNGSVTYNEYIEDMMMRRNSLDQNEIDFVMKLVALTDDSIIKSFNPRYDAKSTHVYFGDNRNVLTIKKGSRKFYNKATRSFEKIIKIYNPKTKLYDLYQLGNVITVAGKESTFENPVYFKTNSLGYRNTTRAAFSVRADGKLNENGEIVSLLRENNASSYMSLEELDEKQYQKLFRELKMTNVLNVVSADEYVADEISLSIDNSDAVFYIYSGIQDELSKECTNYAAYKNKPFYVISEKDIDSIPTLADGSSYTVIGAGMFNNNSIGLTILERIVAANKNSSIIMNKKNTKDAVGTVRNVGASVIGVDEAQQENAEENAQIVDQYDDSKIEVSDEFVEEWSKKEGWNRAHFYRKVLPQINKAWQIEFKLAEDQSVQEQYTGSMDYEYGNERRDDITSKSTLQAIKNGERTATTRYEKNDKISYWKQAKVGDVIKWKDKKGNSVKVVVTKPLTKLTDGKQRPSEKC